MSLSGCRLESHLLPQDSPRSRSGAEIGCEKGHLRRSVDANESGSCKRVSLQLGLILTLNFFEGAQSKLIVD